MEDSKESKINERLENIFEEYHLNSLQRAAALKFIKEKIADPENTNVIRAREWVLKKMNSKPIPPPNSRQKGCPDILPGLRAQPWWDPCEFPWVAEVEEAYPLIKNELLSLYRKGGFQPYRGPSWASDIPAPDIGTQSHDTGDWNVFYLYLHGMSFPDNLEKCPETVNVINNIIPRHYEHAFFSAVNPDTHIVTHHGPTNKKLRLHLPITGAEGTRLRAGEETRTFGEGKVRVFDDSFDHEAWHQGNSTRVNLIIDFWHPDLTQEEVKFFKMLQNAKSRIEKAVTEGEEDTFYSIIEKAKDLRPEDNSWWTLSEEDQKALQSMSESLS